jgi:hypothetical protein
MSSIHVDDQLFQLTAAIAAAQGMTVDQFVSETLRHAVGSVASPSDLVHQSTRNGLPVMDVNGKVPAIDPQKVRDSIAEEGF